MSHTLTTRVDQFFRVFHKSESWAQIFKRGDSHGTVRIEGFMRELLE